MGLMLFLCYESHTDVIEAFNSTIPYLDNLPNIDNDDFKQIVDAFNPKELEINKVKTSNKNAHVWTEIWVAPCENVCSGQCRQPRPRSDCASAQSDHGLIVR